MLIFTGNMRLHCRTIIKVLLPKKKKCKLFNIELAHRINNSIEHYSEKVGNS